MSDRDGTFDLYTTTTHGGPVKHITDPSFAGSWPNWSPLGNDIAFVRCAGGARDLYVAHRNGSGLTQLTDTPARDEVAPAWSPDGDRILYLGCTGTCDLFVRNADGSGGETKLTTGGGFGAADWQRVTRDG